MISKKYYGLVLTAIMSIVMGLLMSGIVTAINTGVDGDYVSRWFRAFVVVAPIAFIVLQFVGPIARSIAGALTGIDAES